jgi:hypothetical protein
MVTHDKRQVATTLVFVVGVVHNFARWIHGAS